MVGHFIKQSEIGAAPEEVFGWHARPEAIDLLTPPWERVEVIERARGLEVGSRAVFKVYAGPFWRLWVAEHVEHVPGRLFADVQRRGPFARWYHRHRFEPTRRGTTLMTDEVDYALPGGRVCELLTGPLVRARLERMFDYRHAVVAKEVPCQS